MHPYGYMYVFIDKDYIGNILSFFVLDTLYTRL